MNRWQRNYCNKFLSLSRPFSLSSLPLSLAVALSLTHTHSPSLPAHLVLNIIQIHEQEAAQLLRQLLDPSLAKRYEAAPRIFRRKLLLHAVSLGVCMYMFGCIHAAYRLHACKQTCMRLLTNTRERTYIRAYKLACI